MSHGKRETEIVVSRIVRIGNDRKGPGESRDVFD